MYKYHDNINKNHNFWKQKPYKSMSASLFLQKTMLVFHGNNARNSMET